MDDPTRPDVSDVDAGVVAEAQAIIERVAVTVDLDAMAADLDGVDAALRRLDEGTYGTCEVCTADLTDEVLEADPVARRCPNHPLASTLPGTTPRVEPVGPPADEPPADEPPADEPPAVEPLAADEPPPA